MSETMAVFWLAITALLCVSSSDGFLVSRSDMDPEEYCTDRDGSELFRIKVADTATERDSHKTCSEFYRCTSGSGGTMQIIKYKCQSSMFFDVERQVCDIRRRVQNCLYFEKERKTMPKWPLKPGEVSGCPDNEIQCGSEECVARTLFCDDVIDCADGSDENICTPQDDPNRASKCDTRTCLISQGCFCSQDGTHSPGGLKLENIPQMIMVSFSGAVNENNFASYEAIFDKVKNKANGCSGKGTFFVSHAFTNYSAVQELSRKGHEIGVHSITNTGDPKYWKELSITDYMEEFDGARLIIEEFANLTRDAILGVRIPGGRVGGNKQFRMMNESGFLYDASIAAPRGNAPIWPYTLDHTMPHKCVGVDQNCPSQSFPYIWAIPLNELDRREDILFNERLTGCHYIDSCTIEDAEQFRYVLDNNLAHHLSTNRAPFGLHFTAAYFERYPELVKVFNTWLKLQADKGDISIVTMQQVISWMLEPRDINSISNFDLWKENCDVQGLPLCSLPNACSNRVPRLFPREDSMSLYTCAECPNTYPWLYDPYGQGYEDDFF